MHACTLHVLLPVSSEYTAGVLFAEPLAYMMAGHTWMCHCLPSCHSAARISTAGQTCHISTRTTPAGTEEVVCLLQYCPPWGSYALYLELFLEFVFVCL